MRRIGGLRHRLVRSRPRPHVFDPTTASFLAGGSDFGADNLSVRILDVTGRLANERGVRMADQLIVGPEDEDVVIASAPIFFFELFARRAVLSDVLCGRLHIFLDVRACVRLRDIGSSNECCANEQGTNRDESSRHDVLLSRTRAL